jgi:hypothetical protein
MFSHLILLDLIILIILAGMKSEEAITGYLSWQKLLTKTRAHIGLSS